MIRVLSHLAFPLLYLDPGTGSMVIQMLLGALLAIGLFVRIFWRRIKAFFIGQKVTPEADDSAEDDDAE